MTVDIWLQNHWRVAFNLTLLFRYVSQKQNISLLFASTFYQSMATNSHEVSLTVPNKNNTVSSFKHSVLSATGLCFQQPTQCNPRLALFCVTVATIPYLRWSKKNFSGVGGCRLCRLWVWMELLEWYENYEIICEVFTQMIIMYYHMFFLMMKIKFISSK